MTGKRVLFSIILLALVLIAPYWIYLPVLLAGILYFSFFWEAVIFGLLIDSLYGVWPPASVREIPISLVALALLLLVPLIKRRMRFHA